jgi:hypothetical protein
VHNGRSHLAIDLGDIVEVPRAERGEFVPGSRRAFRDHPGQIPSFREAHGKTYRAGIDLQAGPEPAEGGVVGFVLRRQGSAHTTAPWGVIVNACNERKVRVSARVVAQRRRYEACVAWRGHSNRGQGVGPAEASREGIGLGDFRVV